jgi:zona occludens toxin
MPLKAYVGLQRAGKTYEVVVNVILPAMRQGRRVVSNIAGLNEEAFRSILFAEGFPEEKIGKLIHIDHEIVKGANFWLTDTDNDTGTETVIQPGDLVALDEIWRFWKKRGDIHPRCMNFFRMHGHMTHSETGLICEVALITQSINDINENIKDVIQETFRMVKNTKLGSDKSYIVHIFQLGSIKKADFIRTLPPRFYSSEFFPLYKSHSQHKEGDAAAIEKNPDDRSSILKGGLFKIGIPVALIMMIIGVVYLWRVMHPAPVVDVSIGSPVVSGIPIRPVIAQPEINELWRVSGYYMRGGTYTFIIVNASGVHRYLVNPPSYQFQGFSSVSVLLPEGGFATSWTSFGKVGIL